MKVTSIHGKVEHAMPQGLPIVLPWPHAQATLDEVITQGLQLLLHELGPALLFTEPVACPSLLQVLSGIFACTNLTLP